MSLSIGPVLLPSLTDSIGTSTKANSSNSQNDTVRSDSSSSTAVHDAATPSGPDGSGQVVEAPRVENYSSEQPSRQDPYQQESLTEDLLGSSQNSQAKSINNAVANSIDSVIEAKLTSGDDTAPLSPSNQIPIEFSSERLGIDLTKFQPNAAPAGISASEFQSSIHVPNWLKGISLDELLTHLESGNSLPESSSSEQLAPIGSDLNLRTGSKLDILA